MARKKKEDSEDTLSADAEEKPEEKPEKKKKLSSKEEREETLKALFERADKKYGKDSMVRASEFRFRDVPRISTGIYPLDYCMGGGLPVGRISLFYGHKETSKTTKLLRAAGMAQRYCSACWSIIRLRKKEEGSTVETFTCKCGENRKTVVAWSDVEGVWNGPWASKFLKTEDLIFSQPDTAEQALDTIDAMVRSGAVDVIIADSIAAMTPKSEIAQSTADTLQPGVQARLVGSAMRKFVSGLNEVAQSEGRRPTIWFTNQIRMKVGVMFGSPETIPGGLAQGFATSVEVRTKHGQYKMDDVTQKPIFAEMSYQVTKNKTGPSHMEGSYNLVLGHGVDGKKVGDVMDEEWSVDMGEKAGFIQESQTNKTRVTWNGEEYSSRGMLVKYFRTHRPEYEAFVEDMMPVLIGI